MALPAGNFKKTCQSSAVFDYQRVYHQKGLICIQVAKLDGNRHCPAYRAYIVYPQDTGTGQGGYSAGGQGSFQPVGRV
jgi:hypothetical protein